jgi:hypothetical protein
MTILKCAKCKEDTDIPDCATCGSWTCPKCGNVNEIMPVTEDGNWLDGGLCNYVGDGSDLPTGGRCKVVKSGTPWGPELLARSWTVSDASTDEGVAQKSTKELTADDTIIGVNLNPKTIAGMVTTYGKDFYRIKTANGTEMSLDDWQAKFGTNGLGLVAIRNMRKAMMGEGVHF